MYLQLINTMFVDGSKFLEMLLSFYVYIIISYDYILGKLFLRLFIPPTIIYLISNTYFMIEICIHFITSCNIKMILIFLYNS